MEPFLNENSLMLDICCESTEEHCLQANTSLDNNKSKQGQQNTFEMNIEGTDSWHEDNSETKLLYKHEGTFSEATYPNDTVCNEIEIKCCGLQHFRIQKYLCSVDDKYAVLRGKAILLWKYDYHNGNE